MILTSTPIARCSNDGVQFLKREREAMKFTIDVDKWLRGEGEAASRLLRKSDGKMCCIGQACLQVGISPEDILDLNSLGDVATLRKVSRSRIESVGCPYAIWLTHAYEVNDGTADRDLLRQLFASGGHELIFSDEA